MFSILPDLTPHDSHSLWYTSSRNPLPPASLDQANQHGSLLTEGGNGDGPQRDRHRRQHGGSSQAALERTALARLRADEAYQDRRRHNVGNFGATWLKPPGIAKSLFQLREERREQEEHAEAVRREQLAQQLAEAEEGAAAAATAAAVAAAAGGMVGEDGQIIPGGGEDEMMGDGDPEAQPEEEERDLDDEIPDADEEGFGYDGADSDEDSSEDRTETTDDDDTEDGRGGNGGGGPAAELRQIVAAEDRVLGMMSRGQARQQDVEDILYGGEDEVDDEDRAEMLQEDDLAHPHSRAYGHGLLDDDDGLDMNMDGDLDDEIPEAESGMYEHTDTEASLMTSDDEHSRAETSFAVGQHSASARFSSARAPHRGGVHNPRHSIDINSILSRDGSSMAGSSPMMRRH